jgi:transposase
LLRDLPKDHRRKLIMMGYKRLGKWIDWYAKKQGVPLAIVKPNGTSSECPKCSSKLEKNGYRRLRCPRCGFEVDRDVVGKLNIRKRGLRRLKILNLSGGSLTTPSASQMTDVSPNRWGDNEPSERNDDQGEGLKAGEVSGSSDRFG